MLILTKGYEKPQNTDTSDAWMPAMERNIQRMNDHTHNGTDGAPVANTSQNILAASWVATAGGTYRQLVTVPAPYSYDTCEVWFNLSTGELVYPSVERVSASQYYVYTNDNTLTYVAHYR